MTAAPRICVGLRDLERPLSSVEPDPRNPREHPEEQVEAIADSLRRHGQDQPLVARREDGRLIKGEGRWRAMNLLGWDSAAVLLLDEGERAALRRNLADHGARRHSYLEEPVLVRLLDRVRDDAGGEGEEDPAAGFSVHFLERLAEALDEDAAGEGVGSGPDAAGDVEEPSVETVVLVYDRPAFEEVRAALEDAERRLSLSGRTEAALAVLDWWEDPYPEDAG